MAFGADNLAPAGTVARRMPLRSSAHAPAVVCRCSASCWAPASAGSPTASSIRLVIDYGDLPGFPRPSVQGHAGRLVLGSSPASRSPACRAAPISTRASARHPLNTLVRTLKAIGCRALLLTNAAGSLRPEWGAGTLVLVEDHINLQGTNPLLGANDDRIGPRFVDLTEVYAKRLRVPIKDAAVASGIELMAGVYLATLGPAFETPAEIRAYRTLGADLVGMSTVPEAISARHAGLEVAALSIVTNLAAGLAAEPLSHAETLKHSARGGRTRRDPVGGSLAADRPCPRLICARCSSGRARRPSPPASRRGPCR